MTAAEPVSTGPPERSDSWLVRWSPIGGLLFVAGLVALFLTPYGDGAGDTAVEVIQFIDDNEGWVIAAELYALLSLLLLGWFVGGLYARLRAQGKEQESVFALVGGSAFTFLFFVALTVWNAPLLGLTDEDDPNRLQDAQTFLGIEDIGWFTLGGAGVGAALMIFATAVGVLRTRAAPAWVGWLSVLLAVGSLFTVAFFGIFAWLAWILLASIAMLVRERT